MKKLLRLEYIKYTRSTIFYIFIGLFMALVALSEISSIYLSNKFGIKLGFATLWPTLINTATSMNVFIGILIMVSITSEYQYRTMRQHIVDGLDKKDIFIAKHLYALCLSLFAVVFVALSVVVAGYSIGASTTGAGPFDGSQLIGRYFVQVLGYISMAIFFAFLLRSTAVGIIVYLFYMPLESLLGVLVSYLSHKDTMIPQYFPKAVFSNIVTNPNMAKLVNAAKAASPTKATIVLPEQTNLILGCVYIIIFTAGSYLLFKKRDL